MTHEEKQLLLIDLCARLPYFEFMVQYKGEDFNVIDIGFGRVTLVKPFMSFTSGSPLIEEVKPYLRPMSSMTEEEENEWCRFNIYPLLEAVGNSHTRIEDLMLRAKSQYEPIEWLNAHYFDYRGLITMGLALEAPEGMYV